MRELYELEKYCSIINDFGLNRLAFFAKFTTKRKTVKRDVEIIKSVIQERGYAAVVTKFDISRQRIHQIVKEYSVLASELSEKIEISKLKGGAE